MTQKGLGIFDYFYWVIFIVKFGLFNKRIILFQFIYVKVSVLKKSVKRYLKNLEKTLIPKEFIFAINSLFG